MAKLIVFVENFGLSIHKHTTENNESNNGSTAIFDKTCSMWNSNHTNGIRESYCV